MGGDYTVSKFVAVRCSLRKEPPPQYVRCPHSRNETEDVTSAKKELVSPCGPKGPNRPSLPPLTHIHTIISSERERERERVTRKEGAIKGKNILWPSYAPNQWRNIPFIHFVWITLIDQ